jgi:hypothetical protein
MKKVQFVPFALKAEKTTKEVFTNMIIYNSLENSKKAYAQILGVSRDDMLELRNLLITDGPDITHIEPTKLTDSQGRWRIYTSKDKLVTMEQWLKEHLARMVASMDMRTPVSGFETPRLVPSNRTRISSHQVNSLIAIAANVPNLDDDSNFPNLVVNRGRQDNRKGAWKSSPLAPKANNYAASHANGPVGIEGGQLYPPNLSRYHRETTPPQPSPTPDALAGLAQQLEENRKWRTNLELSLQIEKEEHKAFRETIAQDKIEFQTQMESITLLLATLTEGQTGIQQAMTRRDEQHFEEVAAIRQDIAELTASFRDLLHTRTSIPISTPPRLLRTDSDNPLSDSEDLPGQVKKRPPDRSPSKQNPSLPKLSRITEGMNTDDVPLARHP